MPALTKPADFQITTPMGEITVPVEPIKEALNYWANSIDKSDQMDTSISEFFNTDISNLEIKQRDYSGRQYIMWAYSLMEVINEEYETIKVENHKYGDAETPPIWNEEKFNGFTFKIPYKLSLFLRHREDNHPLVISFWPYEQYEIDIKFYFEASNQHGNRYTQLWDKVQAHFNTQGLLKNAKFTADFKFLDVPAADWSDIVVEDSSMEILNRNIINFVPHMNVYLEKNLRSSRGVLITGPPGTGKTLCCNVVMNSTNITTIYVARDAIKHEGQISEIYKMARHLAPTLVIIEDIDTLGGLDRTSVHDHPLLGEFLNALSGVERNSGVITLATTNYPQHLDWALADRPGRFDSRIEFGYPNPEARRQILEKYLTPFNTKKINVKEVVKRTEEFSGAYLQELVQTAFMLAFEQSDYQEDKTSISQQHMESALDLLLNQRKQSKKERGISSESDNTNYYG